MSHNLQGAPTLHRQQKGPLLVAQKANVLLSPWSKEGCTVGKGCIVPCWAVFKQVTSEQVMFLSTEGTGHVKPSQSAILKYYYLSLSSLPPSFLWVGAAQGNHGSGKWGKKWNLDYVYSQGKEERRHAEQSSTGNIAKVFLNWRLYHHLRYFFLHYFAQHIIKLHLGLK